MAQPNQQNVGGAGASRQSSLGWGRHYQQPQPTADTIAYDYDAEAEADATFEDDELYIPTIARDEWLTDNPGKTEKDYQRYVRNSRAHTHRSGAITGNASATGQGYTNDITSVPSTGPRLFPSQTYEMPAPVATTAFGFTTTVCNGVTYSLPTEYQAPIYPVPGSQPTSGGTSSYKAHRRRRQR